MESRSAKLVDANMAQATEELDADVFRRLLQIAAPGKEIQINELFTRLCPRFIADESDERRQFRASSDTNTIIFSMEATRRLEAHACAFAAITIANPLEGSASDNGKREKLLAAASAFLTWGVSHDLQHKLRTPDGKTRPIESIMSGATDELPSDMVALMDADDRRYGRNLFLIASSFIMLHELGHLHYRHVRCEGYWSHRQCWHRS